MNRVSPVLKSVIFAASLLSLPPIALLTAEPVFAEDGAPVLLPSERIKSVIEDVKTTVTSDRGKISEEALDEKLKLIILPMFNFEEMSRRSLGAYWSKGTPEEQKEFVTLFSDLLASTYLKRIKRNAEDSKITQITDRIDGEKAMVKSTVLALGEEVGIDYRLILQDGGWRIYDVVIENVGLVSNYRNEFPAIIREQGFKGLNQKLRDKKVIPPPKGE